MDSSVVSFGSFALHRGERTLRRGGKPLELSPDAVDVLQVLVDHPGQVLADSDILLRLVRPMDSRDVYEHVVSLNTALQADGGSHLALISDRGYTFIGPVVAGQGPGCATTETTKRVVGRAETVLGLATSLSRSRLVTLVGVGGVGKTTTAHELVRHVAGSFEDGVCLVDLATLADGALLPASVALSFGLNLDLSPGAAGSELRLARAVENRRALVVLDNCEHLVDEAARLAEALLTTSGLKILATSRERLRVYGELVHQLKPLELPEVGCMVTAALTFGAVELFAERVRTADPTLVFDDEMLLTAVEICRKVDGIPLGIEIAAANAKRLGVKGLLDSLTTSALELQPENSSLDDRHRTVRAALEWSYALLSEPEQTTFRRLSVFRGEFSLQSALAVASIDDEHDNLTVELVLALATKSMVTTHHKDGAVAFRLLDLARLYASAKVDFQEQQQMAVRHAADCKRRLREAVQDWQKLTRTAWWATHGCLVDDVRAALTWSRSERGDVLTEANLVLESVPVAGRLSLLHEFAGYMTNALSRLETLSQRRHDLEFRLNTALGEFQFFSLDPSSSEHAMGRAKGCSERLASDEERMGVIFLNWANAHLTGNYPEMERSARAAAAHASGSLEPSQLVFGWRSLALALHYRGEFSSSVDYAHRALQIITPSERLSSYFLQTSIDREVAMRVFNARSYWIQGRCDEAAVLAEEAITWARRDRPAAICVALAIAAVPVALWRGEVAIARQFVADLADVADAHGLEYGWLWVQFYRQLLGSDRLSSDGMAASFPDPGPRNVQEADMLATLHPDGLTEVAVTRVKQGLVGWNAPELLRRLALKEFAEGADRLGVEGKLLKALELSRFQTSASWELRCALSLAALWKDGGQMQRGRDLVASVLGKLSQGQRTADVLSARRFLEMEEIPLLGSGR